MTTTSSPRATDTPSPRRPAASTGSAQHGPLGRLGLRMAGHQRAVFVAWALLVVMLGAFAPRVESALAGAGWEASGSQSVQTRDVVQREFGGLSSAALMVVLHRTDGPVTQGPGARAIKRATVLLKKDPRLSTVITPTPGSSPPPRGRS